MSQPRKSYLGDGVYLEMRPEEGGRFVLTTEDGFAPTNTIYLEPEVASLLIEVLQTLGAK